MLERVRIATVSLDSQPGQATQNLAKIEYHADQAKQVGADLVLFPELSLTGFIPNHPLSDHAEWLLRALRGARDSAESMDGWAVDQLRRVARDFEMYLCAGMLEDAGNRLFNTQVLVGPEGLVGFWRKMHVPMFEMPFYQGGGTPLVAETKLGRIGVNICFDAFLPESTRLLAIQNAEIVLFPFAADPPPATSAAWQAWAQPVLHCRCYENGVFGVACNYGGRVEFAQVVQDFPGGSLFLGPHGQVLSPCHPPSTQPSLAYADLERTMLIQARAEPDYLYRFRRPELYGPLSTDDTLKRIDI